MHITEPNLRQMLILTMHGDGVDAWAALRDHVSPAATPISTRRSLISWRSSTMQQLLKFNGYELTNINREPFIRTPTVYLD